MFIIEGQQKLSGTIKVSGSKNAALPIICAALLSKKPVTLHNVPRISDIDAFIKILNSLSVKTTFEKQTLTIDASELKPGKVDESLINKMRGSILLFGPILARLGELDLPFPGGCVLGKRSIDAHLHAFEQLGVKTISANSRIHLKVKKLLANQILMPEMSVTATENAITLAALTPGTTILKLVAAEPHVQDLCHFLNKMGAKIKGIGTHYLQIDGVKDLKGGDYTITGDYLEAGTYAIAGLITKGEVKITGIPTGHLDSFWQKLNEMEANYTLEKNAVIVKPTKTLKPVKQLRTAVHPSFPTDLQAPFSVLLTKADGVSNVFETLFEGRLNYLIELEKMGAKVAMLNPHQAMIFGPCRLRGVPIASIDIRAGAAMVLAALAAEGTTEISNIKYIDRGYQNIEEKLSSLGAKITRVEL